MSFRRDCFSVFILLSLMVVGVATALAKDRLRLPTLEVPSELELIENHVFGLERVDGSFGRIVDVAVNSKGDIYILDGGFDHIYKYSESGQLVATFGARGEGPGDFREPIAIAVGPDYRVYVGGTGSLVAVYDENGTPIAGFKRDQGTFAAPVRSIAVDSRGFIYLSTIDVLNQRTIFQHSGTDYSLVKSFGSSFAAGKDVDTRTERAFGGGYLFVNPSGLLLYAQLAPPLVYAYRDDGDLYEIISIRSSEQEVPDAKVTTVGNMTQAEIFMPWLSDKIFGLDDGAFIVTVVSPPGDNSRLVYIDYHNQNGKLRKTAVRESPFRPVCIDAKQMLYVIEDRKEGAGEFPVVVRYEIGSTGNDRVGR